MLFILSGISANILNFQKGRQLVDGLLLDTLG